MVIETVLRGRTVDIIPYHAVIKVNEYIVGNEYYHSAELLHNCCSVDYLRVENQDLLSSFYSHIPKNV